MDLLPNPKSNKAHFVVMHQAGKKHTLVWRSWIDGERIITQWGTLGGRLQQTIDIPGSKGKEGSKAWINPEQSALNTLSRQVTKRCKRGYLLETELSEGLKTLLKAEIADVRFGEEINFSGPQPHNLCFSKPVNSINYARLLKLSKSRSTYGPKILWTVKVNGMMHIVSKDDKGRIWIQSRGKMIVCNEKYPHLVEQFGYVLPPRSIMLAEFYMGEGKKRKDFNLMQRIANSLPDEAMRKQRELGLVQAYVFRIPFWGGTEREETAHNICNLNFIDDLTHGLDNKQLAKGHKCLGDCDHIRGLDIYDDTIEVLLKKLQLRQYEGYVIYQLDAPLGKQAYNFQGKPDRPPVCWKYKPSLEDDFIAFWDRAVFPSHCSSKCGYKTQGERIKSLEEGICTVCGKALKPDGSWGSGKNRERIGAISLYQYDKHGILQYISDCSGMSDKIREEMTHTSWPRVVNVIYKERSYISAGDDSNALFHPSFERFRDDKPPDECINKEL